jgi:hypothetical protein
MIIQADIKDKVLEGCQLAIERLLEQKRKANSYVVISDNGKVIKIKATELEEITSGDKSIAKSAAEPK